MLSRRRFLARALAASGAARALAQSSELDLKLVGGIVHDGTGRSGRRADVGIGGDRIAAIGDLSGMRASRTIDVDGLVVSPGFVDVHTHSEDELLEDGRAESKIRQGVTTEIFGMDGSSYPPAEIASSLEALERAGIALNAATFVGQGTIRGEILGMTDRPARADEVALMQDLARTALGNGALGISSGLEYTPGGFASASEIAGVCEVLSASGGLYATHMRNEDDRVVEAVEEAIEIAERAGVGLHISHLKCQGRRNWDKVDAIFRAVEAAEARGVSVSLDRYPYIAYSTGLSNLMPLWSREGGTARFLSRLSDEAVWPRIEEAMREKIELLGSWDAVLVSSVRLPEHAAYQGKTVAEIVEESGDDPYRFTRDLLIAEEGRVGMVGFGMGEETTSRILAHPSCMPASDGSALAMEGPLRRGNPHPRSYGTFARFLGKYVREEKLVPLEEAVRKMTSLPAERFGLRERGRLVEGFFADVCVFDPETVQDRATFREPHQYASGFELVIVGGRVVLEGGERSDERPGRVLRGRSTA